MLTAAFGYRGDPMNLSVPDLDAALPFYLDVLGFRLESRTTTPVRSAVLALLESFRVKGLDPDVTVPEHQETGRPSRRRCKSSTGQRPL